MYAWSKSTGNFHIGNAFFAFRYDDFGQLAGFNAVISLLLVQTSICSHVIALVTNLQRYIPDFTAQRVAATDVQHGKMWG